MEYCMPIIPQIGRQSLKLRLLVWSIYGILLVGSVAMIYPFLLMIAGSTKSGVDAMDSRVVPAFLHSDEALYRKHIEALFNEFPQTMQNLYDSDAPSFSKLKFPAAVNSRFAGAWDTFVHQADLPHYSYMVGGVWSPMSRGVMPATLRDFKRMMIRRFGGDIGSMNAEMQTEFVNWNAFHLVQETCQTRRERPGTGPFELAFREFKASRPIEERCYISLEGFYRNNFLKKQYTRDISAYNAAHGTHYGSWREVHLDQRIPQGTGRTDKEREDWESFARTISSLYWIRAAPEAALQYHAFLEAKYRQIDALNRLYGMAEPLAELPATTATTERNPPKGKENGLISDGRDVPQLRDRVRGSSVRGLAYKSFNDVPLVDEPPGEGLRLSDWDAFLQGWKDPDTGMVHKLPVSMIRIHSVDFIFRDWLVSRYGDLAGVNAACGTAFSDWLDIMPPQLDLHFLAFEKAKGRLRWEFATRNYVTVIDFIMLHGNGVVNSAIYCMLAILAALIVNPLAAYALSRCKFRAERKILLFLMMTMAFPPMVTQIPAFLMLREFGLLNTFWALILPGLANGYWIFLLKGFFDSLPQELYESASIDGAGELRIFWQITMSLSKPVLAVIALHAFTAAYSNFMMALLICQDEKMWTLMPWLYQLQDRSGQGVIFASLIIAAIPTFIVFTFCQKVIIRGIVVPVEK